MTWWKGYAESSVEWRAEPCCCRPGPLCFQCRSPCLWSAALQEPHCGDRETPDWTDRHDTAHLLCWPCFKLGDEDCKIRRQTPTWGIFYFTGEWWEVPDWCGVRFFILVQNWLITHLWVYLEELREAPLNSCISCPAQSGSLLAACSKALRKAYRYLFWRMLALSCLHMCLYFSWRYEQSLSSRDLREEPPSSSNLLRKRFIAFIMRYTFLWVTFKYF